MTVCFLSSPISLENPLAKNAVFFPVTALVILSAPASDDEGSTAATDGSTLRTSPAEHGGSVGSESGGSAIDSVAGEHNGEGDFWLAECEGSICRLYIHCKPSWLLQSFYYCVNRIRYSFIHSTSQKRS